MHHTRQNLRRAITGSNRIVERRASSPAETAVREEDWFSSRPSRLFFAAFAVKRFCPLVCIRLALRAQSRSEKKTGFLRVLRGRSWRHLRLNALSSGMDSVARSIQTCLPLIPITSQHRQPRIFRKSRIRKRKLTHHKHRAPVRLDPPSMLAIGAQAGLRFIEIVARGHQFCTRPTPPESGSESLHLRPLARPGRIERPADAGPDHEH